MSRWEPNAADRLAQAALELFVERGFDQTTVADIAERAGLTERTFFRHFADKREVLFKGQDVLSGVFVDSIAQADASATPMDAVAASVEAAARAIQDRRDFALQRQAAITANTCLQERELSKLAGIGTSLAEALRARGVREPAASLAAESGVAVFRVAFERWLAGTGKRDLAYYVRDSFKQLRAVAAES